MLITEISENDFRKLNLKVYRNERVVLSENIPGHPLCQFQMVEKNINDILDEQIDVALTSGYESDMRDLEVPVTIAIHKFYTNEDLDKCIKNYPNLDIERCKYICLHNSSYLDKFMNRFTGAQTFQIGWGIKHLYSTRDYYEAHEDYWRVKKKDTAVIYRVHLEPRPFILKHKTVRQDWPYNTIPDGAKYEYDSVKLAISYDLQDDGSWKEVSRSCEINYANSTCHAIIPIDEKGKKICR